jgi:hypothetical protein
MDRNSSTRNPASGPPEGDDCLHVSSWLAVKKSPPRSEQLDRCILLARRHPDRAIETHVRSIEVGIADHFEREAPEFLRGAEALRK